jgi:ATP-binding cassette, subfamily B, bacterial PglK
LLNNEVRCNSEIYDEKFTPKRLNIVKVVFNHMDIIQKLRALFGKKEKKKFVLLFLLMVFSALFETMGIGLIVPFVGIITNPEMIHQTFILSAAYDILGFQSTNTFLITATIALLVVFILKNLYLVLFHNIQYRVVYNEQVKLSKRLLTAYLSMPYIFHLQRNSADLVRNTNTEVQKVFNFIIKNVFLFVTELLVILSILALLLIMAPIVTILSAVVLGTAVAIFLRGFRHKISEAGKQQQKAQGGMIKWVNQGLGAGKEVKVSGREKFFVDAYSEESKLFANAARFHSTIQQVPRMFIETIMIATILLVILVIMIRSQDITTLVSTIALFAMASFRLMPSINRMVGSITSIRHNKPALDVIYQDLKNGEYENSLKEKKVISQPINVNTVGKIFKNEISVENVSFRYPGFHQDAINNISLTIPIGQSVAFVGETGSGKTTMVDIILGVLDPYQGSIKIDRKETRDIWKLWQQKIGYIPQFIYLSDDSIRQNIAFGLEKEDINDQAVWEALEKAQLKEFVEKLPDKLDTFVGERGVRLSGGQRQRIGIARALYHNPEILFMDEATSALDNDTEKEIIKAIDSLKGEMTLIIIAHRLSTIENCDVVFELKNGSLKEQSLLKMYN